MKFSPTITLALALAAGMAGAAAAQTAATPGATPDSQQAAQSVQAASQAGQPTAAPAQPQAAQPIQSQAAAPPQPAQAGADRQPAQSGTSLMQARQDQGGRSEQIRYAQERLAAIGLYNGPADGLMDPDTRAALAKFQQQHGLKRTSDLDRDTYDRLTSQAIGSGSGMPANAPASGTPQPSGAAPTGAGGNNNPTAPATNR